METCPGSPMEHLLSLKFRGCGKAGAMEIPSGLPTAPWTMVHFPTSHIYIKIGHFYLAQNRTFLFCVDSANWFR